MDAFYARSFHLPAEVVAAVKACRPHPQHMVSVLAGPILPDGMTEEYARLGYKRLPESPQPLMQALLSGKAPAPSMHRIGRVEIGEGKYRYALEQAGTAVSSAEVVWTDADTIYLFAMQTLPECRRIGLATALLTHIHQDAYKNGATRVILWSSPTGLPFYVSLSYEAVVTGHGFIPGSPA